MNQNFRRHDVLLPIDTVAWWILNSVWPLGEMIWLIEMLLTSSYPNHFLILNMPEQYLMIAIRPCDNEQVLFQTILASKIRWIKGMLIKNENFLNFKLWSQLLGWFYSKKICIFEFSNIRADEWGVKLTSTIISVLNYP